MGTAIFTGSKEPAPPTKVGGFHPSLAQHIFETRSKVFLVCLLRGFRRQRFHYDDIRQQLLRKSMPLL